MRTVSQGPILSPASSFLTSPFDYPRAGHAVALPFIPSVIFVSSFVLHTCVREARQGVVTAHFTNGHVMVAETCPKLWPDQRV